MDLPTGFTVRPATPDDVAAVCDLVIAVDIEEYGEPDYEEADVREEWSHDRFDTARDTWLVHAPDGTLRGYASTWDKQPHTLVIADVFSRPGEPDLYPWLIGRIGERVAEHAAESGQTTTHVYASEPNARKHAALQADGYDVCRVFRRMVLGLEAPVADPAPGDGVVVRQVTDGDIETVYRLQHEAFSEHFDYVEEPYDAWRARLVDTETYRPRFWFIAEADGEPVGYLVGQQHDDGGWVKGVGTIRAARGRGVGTALLLSAFGAFREAGLPKVGLGVDSGNTTGAMALYERIGMRAEHRYDCYEKVVTRS